MGGGGVPTHTGTAEDARGLVVAAGDTSILQGRRLYASEYETEPEDFERLLERPGDYIYDSERGWWWVVTPRGGKGTIRNHRVIVHVDGTISVSPSIMARDGYHGFLENGVWREVV